MKLRIAQKTLEGWKLALVTAGTREIGGVLFGEHVGTEDFRVVNITQQRRRGGEASFRRKSREAKRGLKRLSAAHGNDHERFNYLGECIPIPMLPLYPVIVTV